MVIKVLWNGCKMHMIMLGFYWLWNVYVKEHIVREKDVKEENIKEKLEKKKKVKEHIVYSKKW